ncbi:hypothetical protein K438DRAFT_1952785 [Mycena galopus ATCC 62051]|nr:hypothetical protein K438DRAFT_1952785 [Mycena galopus ATCC 62051]
MSESQSPPTQPSHGTVPSQTDDLNSHPLLSLFAGSDADLLQVREHNDKMAARVVGIDAKLGAIHNRFAEFRTQDTLLAQLSIEWEAQERIIEDAELVIRNAKLKINEIRGREPRHLEGYGMRHRILDALNIQQAALEKERLACSHFPTPEVYHSAPIRRIPAEVLSEIFASAKDGEDPIGTGITTLVTQVCSRWRNIACESPLLWSSFALPLFGKQGTVDLLRMTLERCRGAALSITVDVSGNPDMNGRLAGDQKIEILLEHAEKIVALRFRGVQNVDAMPRFPAFRDRLPRLEILQARSPHLWRAMGNAFQHAPSLHTLELGRSSDLLELASQLPLEQIRVLRLSMSTSGYHLARLPNLTSLTSVQTGHSSVVRVSQPPPELLSLNTWGVDFAKPHEVHPDSIGPSSTDHFFSRFRTPALHTLRICRLASVDGIIRLVERSECKLAALVLEEPFMPAADLARLFAKTPDLQTFEIISGEYTTFDDALCNSLIIRDHDDGLLPRLTQFRLDGTYDIHTHLLLAMLASRTSASAAALLEMAEISLRDRVVPPNTLQLFAGLNDVAITIIGQD